MHMQRASDGRFVAADRSVVSREGTPESVYEYRREENSVLKIHSLDEVHDKRGLDCVAQPSCVEWFTNG